MIVVQYQDIELDHCPYCRGTWFDSGEMDLLLRSMELEGSSLLLDRITHRKQAESTEKKRRCPICNRNMGKYAVGPVSGILVDACLKEHGIWFDSGEVRSLVAGLEQSNRGEYSSEQELVSFLGEMFEGEQSQNIGGNN